MTEFQDNLAVSIHNIGNQLRVTGKPIEALAAYQESRTIFERLARENPTVPKFQSKVALSHNNIGVLLFATGKPVEALAAHEQALAIQERLAHENPTVTQLQSELAGSHNNIGRLLQATGKPAEALAAHEQAMAIRERLARENPTVTQFPSELAVSHAEIGNLLNATGRLTEALAAHEQALAIQERLAHENPTVIEFQSRLAGSHNNIGNFLCTTGKPAEALAAYDQARAIWERLARENPTVIDFQSDLAASRHNMGILLSATGKPTEALAAYEQALAIGERLARENPTVIEFQSTLGRALDGLALLDLEANRFELARDRLLKAVEHQKHALAANPTNPVFRQFLKNHYVNLQTAAVGLKDVKLAAELRRRLAELAATDPQAADLDQRLAAVRDGQAAKDAEELLALGQRAYDTCRFTLAARLFGEALQRDATLADNRESQHAYNAACCAALAASGQNLDDPQPEETAKAQHRTQALTWLQAELACWTKFLESATAEQRQVVVETLQHWQADLDLASVREPAQLSAMSEEERGQWSTLWTRVADLFAQAAKETGKD